MEPELLAEKLAFRRVNFRINLTSSRARNVLFELPGWGLCDENRVAQP
jgi:hypothetical protein